MKDQVLDYSSPTERPSRQWDVGTWMAIVVVSVILLLVVSSWLVPIFSGPNRRVRIQCAMNLRDIGQQILLYKNDHQGQYPDSLEQVMLHADIEPHLFVCPESGDKPAAGATRKQQAANLHRHMSFIYLGKGLRDPVDPERVIAYEPLENHDGAGMNILFADGHVEWFRQVPKELSDFLAGDAKTRPVE